MAATPLSSDDFQKLKDSLFAYESEDPRTELVAAVAYTAASVMLMDSFPELYTDIVKNTCIVEKALEALEALDESYIEDSSCTSSE